MSNRVNVFERIKTSSRINIFERIKDRDKVIKNQKFSELKKGTGSQVINEKIKIKLLYEYYICDYCGAEIKIIKDRRNAVGGLAVLPASLTKRRAIEVALCNKCLNPVIEFFEERK